MFNYQLPPNLFVEGTNGGYNSTPLFYYDKSLLNHILFRQKIIEILHKEN